MIVDAENGEYLLDVRSGISSEFLLSSVLYLYNEKPVFKNEIKLT